MTVPVSAREITDASIGPTQGVQRRPMESPIKIPPKKPLFVLVFGVNLEIFVKASSKSSWNLGIKRPTPKRRITKTEKSRRLSAGIPISFTIDVKNRVKNVKLKTKPNITPSGRFAPPVRELEMIIGKIGSMQGDSTVTMPARKANARRIIIT